MLSTSDDEHVPLSHDATIIPKVSHSTITRIDLERILTITADVDKEKINIDMLRKYLTNFLDKLLINFPNIIYNFKGESNSQKKILVV